MKEIKGMNTMEVEIKYMLLNEIINKLNNYKQELLTMDISEKVFEQNKKIAENHIKKINEQLEKLG